MKIYILLSLIFVFASQTLASSRDEFGEYTSRMGQKFYTRRFSTPSPPPISQKQKLSNSQGTSVEIETVTIATQAQTIIKDYKSVSTETDVIPFKSVGVNAVPNPVLVSSKAINTNPEIKTQTQTIAMQTEKLSINDMSSQTKLLVLEDKETNTSPFEGHGKHLYNVSDKITQTQSRELMPGDTMQPLMTDSGLD